jgi:hypothetical protein
MKFKVQNYQSNQTKHTNFQQVKSGRIISLLYNNTINVMVANISNPQMFVFDLAYSINMNCSGKNQS